MSQHNPPDASDPTGSSPGPQGPGPQGFGPQGPGGNELRFGPAPTRPSTKRVLVIGGLIAAVVLVGAGGTYAWTTLASKGGQPAEVIPSTAIGYVRVDLDPSAGQKIATTRFLGKLPKLKKDGQDVDVKQTLWTWIAASDKKLQSLNYDTDVKPWLGDRAAIAIMPGGTSDKPNVVFALQVTDEGKAKEGISKIATTSAKDDVEVTTKNGFALITPKGGGSTVLSDLGKGSLASNTTFSGDMSALGDQGIASMWFDGKGFGEFAKRMGGNSAVDTAQLAGMGRVATALRFDADYVELAGITRGATTRPDSAPETGGAGALPEDTVAAIQVNGLGDAVAKAWPQLEKALGSSPAGSGPVSQIEEEFGVKLPDDLKVLLGKRMTLSMPGQDFASFGQSDQLPTIGATVVTTDAKRADEILQGLGEKAGIDNFVKRKVDGDKVFLATTDEYLASIQKDGKLGQTDAFKKAVADGDKATTAVFVNLDKLEPVYLKSVPADYQEFVKALSAVGVSGTQNADGDGTFALRLVGN